ncbi:hypothetical protein [[Mycoplasma] gypis]|uniref:hypothetical protein n=1 Tax=[Mycoplasma] gypis TaxID=92404 RepID=UPI0019688BCE|nr:hypothetical protein [[Mycoplasma] gypis]MBN0919417.1 hypothetical protein [[Mycoplasma] gypis]
MSFKLGFINKNNPEIRFKTTQKIMLSNFRNEILEQLYPEVMLNLITYDDFEIKIKFKVQLNSLLLSMKMVLKMYWVL